MAEIIEFDYDKIMRYGFVINCKTEWQADSLLAWTDSKGLTWRNKESYLKKTDWQEYRESTCYYLPKGGYADLSWFRAYGYDILSYEEALLPQYNKTKGITSSENENHLERIYDRLVKIHNEYRLYVKI